jgi:hypothetical protein
MYLSSAVCASLCNFHEVYEMFMLRLYQIQKGFCTEAMHRSPVDGGADGT